MRRPFVALGLVCLVGLLCSSQAVADVQVAIGNYSVQPGQTATVMAAIPSGNRLRRTNFFAT